MTTKLELSEGARTLPLYLNLKAWEAMLPQGVLTLGLMYDGFTVHTRLLLQQIWLIQTNLNQCCGMSWELVTHGISDIILFYNFET
jgi:hypothetical protein